MISIHEGWIRTQHWQTTPTPDCLEVILQYPIRGEDPMSWRQVAAGDSTMARSDVRCACRRHRNPSVLPHVSGWRRRQMTARSTRVGFVRSSIHESSKPRGLDSAHFLGPVLQERSRSDLSMARFVSLQTTDI